jgi:hypothetical protein|tara:strand:+ start:69 stop:269 length:201 start_codon:yes stop_codon:yes gene_type:complete
MSMLMMLKEGGSLLIDTIGNLPIDEDIDLLPDAGGATLSLAFRIINDSISVTNTTSTQPRAIVMEV